MKKEIIEIQVKGTEEGVKKIDNLNDSIKDVQKETEETSKKSNELGGTLDKLSGGAITKFKGITSAIKSVNTGFKLMKMAIIGTGIGALLIAVVALGKAFTSSEEGQNKFAKIMGVIGSITGNLVDILATLGEKIIWVFENPKQAIKDFAELIKKNITNRFEGILEYIPQMAKAIKKLFKGDFKGAAETAANAMGKVVLGTDNLTESIKNAGKELNKFGKEIAEDAKKAADIADKRAKADKIERKLITDRAKADRDIAELRFKSEQRDKFTASERVEFLKEASKISEDIANKEIYANNLRLSAKIEENKLTKSDKDALDEVANLKAKSIQLDTAKLNLQKRLQTSLTTFQNEEKAGIKATNDAKQKITDEQKAKDEANEKARLDAIDKIQKDYKTKKENEDAESELAKIELEQTRALAELERLNATEEQKATIIAYWSEKVKEQKATDADVIRIKKEEDYAKELQLDKDKINSKLMVLDAVMGLADRETAIGKALIVIKQLMLAKKLQMDIKETISNARKTVTKASLDAAETGTSIASGTAKAASTLNPVVIAGWAVTAIGVVSSMVSAFKKSKSVAAKFGGGGGASPNISAPKAQMPSFNIVGGSETNQLASAIGGQSQEPVKAYVVSSDVTTSQEMDRNIVESASL